MNLSLSSKMLGGASTITGGSIGTFLIYKHVTDISLNEIEEKVAETETPWTESNIADTLNGDEQTILTLTASNLSITDKENKTINDGKWTCSIKIETQTGTLSGSSSEIKKQLEHYLGELSNSKSITELKNGNKRDFVKSCARNRKTSENNSTNSEIKIIAFFSVSSGSKYILIDRELKEVFDGKWVNY